MHSCSLGSRVSKVFYRTNQLAALFLLLAQHCLPAYVLLSKFVCIHFIRLSNSALLTTKSAFWRLVNILHHKQQSLRIPYWESSIPLCSNRWLRSECQAKKLTCITSFLHFYISTNQAAHSARNRMILVHIRFKSYLRKKSEKYLIRSLFPFAYMPSKLQTPTKEQPTQYLFYRCNKFSESGWKHKVPICYLWSLNQSFCFGLQRSQMLSTEKQTPSCHAIILINKLK